jgi:hypothetical protein
MARQGGRIDRQQIEAGLARAGKSKEQFRADVEACRFERFGVEPGLSIR